MSKQDINKIIGKKINYFTILKLEKYTNCGAVVSARCDCGNIKQILLRSIKSGNTKSCGCFRNTKKGRSRHPLSRVWKQMISRCYDESHSRYESYGAKGIVVCDEWKNDINLFFDWAISNGWKEGLELDKDKLSDVKPGKIYSPEFCCFITGSENCRNKSNNSIIEYNGEKRCVTEWAEILEMPYNRLKSRLVRGWNIEKAFNS